jgi:hypothetical protein
VTSQDFATWLRGFLDAVGGNDLSPDQVAKIREQLNKVTQKAESSVDWAKLVRDFEPSTKPYWPPVATMLIRLTPHE